MSRRARIRLHVCLALLLSMAHSASSQVADDRGASYRMDHFDPLDYGAHPQNWSFAQGNDGKIYVANGTGILVFDGTSWVKIETPGQQLARSLAVDGSGRIYAGTVGDFGYISVDSVGNGFFKSLASDSAAGEFRDVWRIYIREGSIIFMTGEAILIWKPNGLHRIDAPTTFHTSFQMGTSIFVNDLGVGLHVLRSDSMMVAPNGGWFAGKKIYSFHETAAGKALVNVRAEGFFDYDLVTGEIVRKPTVLDDYFARFPVYHAIELHDGDFAYATLGGGAIIATEDGVLVDHLGRNNGFVDDVVNNLFQDHEGSLWAALNNKGILRVALPRRLTFYDSSLGLEGSIRDMGRFDGAMYAATGAGLYRHSSENGRFEKVDGVPISWVLKVVGDTLYVGTESGLYRLTSGGRAEQIFDREVYAITLTSNGLVLGTPSGIVKLNPGDGSETPIREFDFDVRDLFECENEDMIAFTRSNGVKRIVFGDNSIEVHEIPYHPIPPQGRAKLSLIGGQPASQAQDGLYMLDSSCSDRSAILRRTDLLRLSPELVLLSTFEDDDSKVWAVTNDSVFVVSTMTGESESIAELSFEKEHLSVVQVENDGVVWMSVGDELLRLDTDIPINSKASFAPIIEVVSNVGTGSVLASGQIETVATVWGVLELPYDDNDIFVRYSAPIFANNKSLTYSHYLVGRSMDWSTWSSQKSVTFTNLREGKYTFRVKARNDFGKETPEASFSFVILPPWYRTTIAYIAYILSIGIFGFLATKYYQLAVANRKAKEQAIELAREKVVNEKLQEANNQLHVVNERLTVVNALKDEFLATTSHELRTPITAIQGYAGILKEELDGPHAEFADIIDSSSQRLMSTLNAVLDLAKLRSGAVDLFPVETNLKDFCSEILGAHREKANAKQLVLETRYTPEELYICIDQYSLRIIVSNVLDNAIKFSDKGRILLSIEGENEMAVVTIRDEGIGIDAAFLPHVFDEFRQQSETLSRERDGSGLGLSIASRMMDLLNGAIDVQSEAGIGTTVKLSFQLTQEEPKLVRENDRDAVQRDRSMRTLTEKGRTA